MKRLCTIVIILLAVLNAQAQFYLLPNEYHYRLINNLSVIVVDDTSKADVQADLILKVGPYLEDTTLDGLNFLYCHLLEAQLVDALERKLPSAKLSSEVDLEYVAFRFTLPNDERIDSFLAVIYEVFQEQKWDSTDLEQAKLAAMATIDTMVKKPERAAVNHLRLQLWGNYRSHMTIYDNEENILAADSATIAKLEEQFYCPGYGLMTIHGNVNNRAFRFMAQRDFNAWDQCRYSPLNRKVVPEYQKLLFSRQSVMLAPVEQPEFLLLFQGAALLESDKNALTTLLLAKLIDRSDSVQKQLDSLPIQSLSLDFDLLKYAADMRFTLVPNEDALMAGYHAFWMLMDSIAHTDMISDEELTDVKTELISELTIKDRPDDRTRLIQYYWSIGRSEWIKTLESVIAELGPEDVQQVVKQYILNNTYTSSLIAEDTSGISSAIAMEYTSTRRDVYDYTFHFDKNTADISTPNADSLLNSLFQFLHINPHAKIRIIGVAGKDELAKVKDQELVNYLKGIEHFYITPKELIPTNKIRLDAYRAMTIMKYLLVRGVHIKQLEGTGLMLKPKVFPNEMQRRQVYFQMIY